MLKYYITLLFPQFRKTLNHFFYLSRTNRKMSLSWTLYQKCEKIMFGENYCM